MNWEIIEENAGLAKIKVIGVGGAGGNAVIHMINHEIQGADFICANTDSQALDRAKGSTILKLGDNVTRGLGAGADPQVGRAAAAETRLGRCEGTTSLVLRRRHACAPSPTAPPTSNWAIPRCRRRRGEPFGNGRIAPFPYTGMES